MKRGKLLYFFISFLVVGCGVKAKSPPPYHPPAYPDRRVGKVASSDSLPLEQKDSAHTSIASIIRSEPVEYSPPVYISRDTLTEPIPLSSSPAPGRPLPPPPSTLLRSFSNVETEEGFLLFTLAHVTPRTETVRVIENKVWISTSSMGRLIGLHFDVESNYLSFDSPESGEKRTMDFLSCRVFSGDSIQAFLEEDIVHYQNEIFLSPSLWGKFLNFSVQYNEELLQLTLIGKPIWPAQRLALRNESDAYESSGQSMIYTSPATPSGLGVINLGIGIEPFSKHHPLWGDISLGVGLLGGGMVASTRIGTPSDPPQRIYYRKLFSPNPFLRSMYLGQHTVGKIYPRDVFGLSLSNEKILYSDFARNLGNLISLPEGWSYEVLSGGQVVSSSRSSTSNLQAALPFGVVPLTVVAFSPSGQQKIYEILYNNYPEILNQSTFAYTVGGGKCLVVGCDNLFLAGEMRFGLLPSLTIGGGLEYSHSTSNSSVSAHTPFTRMDWAPARTSWKASAMMQPGSVEGLLSISSSSRFAGSFIRGRTFQTNNYNGYSVTSLLQLRTDALFRSVILAGNIERSDSLNSLESVRMSLFGNRKHFFLEIQNKLSGPTMRGGLFFLANTQPSSLFPKGVAFDFAARADKILSTKATIDWALSRNSSLQVISEKVVDRGSSIGLSYHAVVGPRRIRAFASKQEDRQHSSIYVESAYASRNLLSWRAVPTLQSIGLSGIRGRIFQDINYDGVFSPSDIPLENIRVKVGNLTVKTNVQGEYSYWGISPYGLVSVGIDSLDIIEHNLGTARGTSRSIRPTPNIYNSIDFALTFSSEVWGSLTLPWGETLRIPFSIVDNKGNVVSNTVSYEDGKIYVPSLVGGTYILKPDSAYLERYGLYSEPGELRFSVESSESLQLPTFIIQRKK